MVGSSAERSKLYWERMKHSIPLKGVLRVDERAYLRFQQRHLFNAVLARRVERLLTIIRSLRVDSIRSCGPSTENSEVERSRHGRSGARQLI